MMQKKLCFERLILTALLCVLALFCTVAEDEQKSLAVWTRNTPPNTVCSPIGRRKRVRNIAPLRHRRAKLVRTAEHILCPRRLI